MSWRFARTSKWIIRHVLVVVLVAAMVAAGFWQLRRLDDKRDHKALVEARQAEQAVDVATLLPASTEAGDGAVSDALYRSASATGTYVADDSVVVANRTLNGAPGGWVLTPLRLDDGTAVLVNRGFVGFDRDGQVVAPDPPAGEVRVEGLVLPSQERGSLGPVDPEEGTLDVLARADVERVDEQVGYDLLPAYLQAVESDPAEPPTAEGAPALVALGPPEPDEGPHLGYAVQWFIFSAIAAGGYLLLLRRVAHDSALEERAATKGDGDDLDRELEQLLRSEG